MVTRKYTKTLIMLACGIALALASSSCKKNGGGQPPEPDTGITSTDTAPGTEAPKPDQAPVVSDDTLQVILMEGVGPVKFGMSKEEVMQHLGQPERMDGGGIALWYLESKGISLVLNPNLGVQEINFWSKEYPKKYPGTPDISTFTGKTKEGVGMGAGREQIVAAYGEPEKTDSKDPFEILYYDKLRAQFWLAQNKLVNVKMRAP